jgi:glycosyltransferase involved in cell wall biosynthesis
VFASTQASKRELKLNESTPPGRAPVIVHCHLRWEGVWQRPQQILSRIARGRPVVFVEEPVFLPDGERPHLRVYEEQGVTVAQPHVPPQAEDLPRVSAENRKIVRELVAPLLADSRWSGGVRWHYAPMAVYMRDLGNCHTVVYDCMDELSAFKGAPPELVDRERELMAEAHVMFTGGLSMWLNKREHHPNCHRFDSGVDVEHFQRAVAPETPVPADARDLPGPVIGYYGVIDERMDYEAVRALSRAFPGGTVLLVGPVTKVDPAELPQAENIRYTGQRSYAELPGYLKAFDVALVPFADNPATRFLSPTKTLEYFAGLKPVVSSPVKDVVENYADIVRLARSPEEYVAAVREALAADNAERARRGLEKAREKTWDAIVAEMERLVAASPHASSPHQGPGAKLRAAAA